MLPEITDDTGLLPGQGCSSWQTLR